MWRVHPRRRALRTSSASAAGSRPTAGSTGSFRPTPTAASSRSRPATAARRAGAPQRLLRAARGLRAALRRGRQPRTGVHPRGFPRAKAICGGYVKRYARATTEAHGVRVNELENLLLATQAEAYVDARDAAIVAVLADPDVQVNGELTDGGMPHLTATRMTWWDLDFGPDASSDLNIRVARRRSAGFDVFTVPNRRRGLETIDTPDGMVGAARLCGVAALALLDDVRRMRGIPDSEPVLVSRVGRAMTAKAFRDTIAKAAERAGLSYQATYPADDRLVLLDAQAQPSLLRLRDAAIMATMWWASLRSSEASSLQIRMVAEDSAAAAPSSR